MNSEFKHRIELLVYCLVASVGSLCCARAHRCVCGQSFASWVEDGIWLFSLIATTLLGLRGRFQGARPIGVVAGLIILIIFPGLAERGHPIWHIGGGILAIMVFMQLAGLLLSWRKGRLAEQVGASDRFSVIWCIGMFLLHIVVTLLLGAVMFISAMGSFTHGPGAFYYVAKSIMWIWSPLVMSMVEGHLRVGTSPEIVAILWSLGVGLFAGLIGGTLRKQDKITQVASGINPDLIGTPWAHNSSFTTGKANPAEQNSQAESGPRE